MSAHAAAAGPSQASAARDPMNIVLASDGTGNAAGKGNNTNVWRICQALDRHESKSANSGRREQIYFYDDGVGTESFKPLRLLTGALGIGLSRNIKQLYMSLVRAYEPGDRLYLFGFSRGAFTIRSLAGLISRCGIVDRRHAACSSEEALREQVDRAFDLYRQSHYGNDASLASAFKQEFGVTVPDASSVEAKDIPIQFIGVWDTVGAVGVPFDGLRWLVDRVFPLKFHDQGLSDRVMRACHALAIDDERKTFHPTLWDEGDHPNVHQVWFTGMHSNVGGGYPRQGLAHISLYWMMEQAQIEGLRFYPEAVREARNRSNALAKLYDSRSGLSAYYRYKPRDIRKLCQDHCKGKLRLHESVVDRVLSFSTGYLPANLPLDGSTTVDIEPDSGKGEASRASSLRKGLIAAAGGWTSGQPEVDRIIGHRIWLYRALLAATLCLGFVTLYALLAHDPEAAGDPVSGIGRFGKAVLWFLDPFTPGILDEPLHFFLLARPEFWIIALVVFVSLLLLRRGLKARQLASAETMWRGLTGATVPTSGPAKRSAARLWAQAGAGLAALFLLVLLTGAVAVEWTGHPRCSDSGRTLQSLASYAEFEAASETAAGAEDKTAAAAEDAELPVFLKSVSFDAAKPCANTGIKVTAGERYRISVDQVKDWQDGGIEVKRGALGFHTSEVEDLPTRLLMSGFAMLRRDRTAPWFSLRAEAGGRLYPTGDDREIEIEETGELFFFVNDAVCKLCPSPLQTFYGNNDGDAEITIERLK